MFKTDHVSVAKVDVNLFYLIINGGKVGPYPTTQRCSEEYRRIIAQGTRVLSARVLKTNGELAFVIL